MHMEKLCEKCEWDLAGAQQTVGGNSASEEQLS
jgi:hypothetical protein